MVCQFAIHRKDGVCARVRPPRPADPLPRDQGADIEQIRVNPETQVIEEAKFKTFGCGSAIASSSLATEWVKGKTVDEALAIKNMDIVKELALPPVKIHCSVLAEDAIRAAIGDWKKKQESVKPVEAVSAK